MTQGVVDLIDGRLGISFPYDAQAVGAVKEIPGRRWEPEHKRWTAPVTSVRPVRRFAETYGLTTTTPVDDLPDVEPGTRPQIDLTSGRFCLAFDYDRDLVARVRDLPGARWSARQRVWTVDHEAVLEVADFAVSTLAHIGPSAAQTLTAALEAMGRIEASTAADADIDIPGLGGDLMPFQRAGVAYVTRAGGGVLIGDQMGLGKTVQALASLAALDARPAVIVCPASLKLNWRREAERWLPGWSINLITGTRAGNHQDPPADLTILNYDILETWADVLPTPSAVVLDESHYIKNGTTIRTRAAIRLSDRMPHNALRLCLTGTPIVNAPGEIVTQLRFLHRIDEFGGVGEFRTRYQSGHNLTELNRRLRASCMVRRRKDDVLTELPPKRWSTITVTGDPITMREYHRAEADVVSYLSDTARKIALESGASTDEARRIAWETSLRARAAEHLVAVTALKRLAARAKIPAARQWVEDFTATGSKLVVFGHHREFVDEIGDQFAPGMIITGNTPIPTRQTIVERFQSDEGHQVIACSLKAAGVGLTLTAASDVLFLEQGWTPADMDQASDRCHRIGQTDSVTAWTMIAEGTIDEDIAGLIASKRHVVDAATDGITVDPDDETGSILGDLLVRLTERGLDHGPETPRDTRDRRGT
jgi:SNF2 family DNA or RNA helicase